VVEDADARWRAFVRRNERRQQPVVAPGERVSAWSRPDAPAAAGHDDQLFAAGEREPLAVAIPERDRPVFGLAAVHDALPPALAKPELPGETATSDPFERPGQRATVWRPAWIGDADVVIPLHPRQRAHPTAPGDES
jgi:hypothetical protein